MQVKLGRQGCDDKPQGGKGPNKTHVIARHQDQQAHEKQGLEENSGNNAPIGNPGLHHAANFAEAHALHIADLFQATTDKNNADSL